MIGIVLEVRYNTVISTRSVISGLTGEQQLAPQQVQKLTPGAVRSKPAARTAQS